MIAAARTALADRIKGLDALQGIAVWWGSGPVNQSLPLVRLSMVSSVVRATHGGTDAADRCIIQADVFADDPADAQRLRDTLRDNLHCTAATFGGIVFEHILHEASRDSADNNVAHAASDFRISYKVAT